MIDHDLSAITDDLYKLDYNHKPVPCSLLEWGELIRDIEKRRVAYDNVNGDTVSTVFLGIDHGFEDKKLLFETMIFKAKRSLDYCERYSTWDEAFEGHNKAIEWVKDGCKDD